MEEKKLTENTEPEMPLMTRRAKPTDVSFIIDAWLHQYRTTRMVAPVTKEIYFRWFRKRIIKILKNSEILIACNPEDEDQIFSYAVYRHIGDVGILSWIYTKNTFRNLGIATSLFKQIAPIEVVTHIGPSFQSYFSHEMQMTIDKLPKALIYNPFLDQFPIDPSHLLDHEDAENILKGEKSV